jgi:hypothetical protein
MLEAGQTAYVVKVTRTDSSPDGDEAILLYAVLTDTAESAVAAGRRAVGAGDGIEPVGATLSAETIKKLGLLYGQTLLL